MRIPPSHSLPDGRPRSDRFRRGGRESEFLRSSHFAAFAATSILHPLMKPIPPLLAALLLSLIATASGQIPVPAGAPAASPQLEFQKWLADLDAQWKAAFKRDVSDAYTAENDKLRGQYVAALEAGITKASSAGDLNAAIVLRNEQKRFAEANGIPAQDDAADPLPVKQLRAAWRSQLPRIETDRATRAKALLAKYDQVLAQAQAQLVKGNRIDDAILAKAKRDEVAAAWLAGIPIAPPPVLPSGPEYLDDLDEFDVKLGWGKLGKHGAGPDEGSRILIRGINLSNSIVAHPPGNGASSISYRLAAAYSTFKGTVTVPDRIIMKTPLTFRVVGDNNVLWKSHPVKNMKDAQDFSISVRNVKKLTLEVNSPGTASQAWAVWLKPSLSK